MGRHEIYILQDGTWRNQWECHVLPKIVLNRCQVEILVSLLPMGNISQTIKGFFLRLFHLLYEAIQLIICSANTNISVTSASVDAVYITPTNPMLYPIKFLVCDVA